VVERRPKAINNTDRAQFVLEHRQLSKRLRESGLTTQQFIRKNIKEINDAIRSSRRKPDSQSQQ